MDTIRRVIRKIREAQGRDLCLWLIPRKDGRVKKVRFGFNHACAFGTATVLMATGVVYLGLDYSKFISAKSKIESLFKATKAQSTSTKAGNSGDDSQDQLISLDYHESLMSQIKFLTDEHYKSKAYEAQLKSRLTALKAALESELPMDLLQEDPKLSNPLAAPKKDVGGAEIECKSGAEDCLPRVEDVRASLAWNFGDMLPSVEGDSGTDLLGALNKYLKVLESMPITRPAVGWVTSGFGLRRSPFSGNLTKHQGIDFSLPSNAEVVTTADGVVKSVVRTRTYGLMIEIQHNKRVTTRYAHLNRSTVKVGDKVCRGEVIGVSGSTGRSTGPHLHYEVRVDKKPVDPRKFLAVGASLSPDLLEMEQ